MTTAEHIAVLETAVLQITPGARWTPSVGGEILRFLDNIHSEAKDQTQQDALEILSRGTPPGQVGPTAGLVAGYVQSGKTTSFTAVAALARDNGYGMVVVIAGTSNNLLEQTRKRLAQDLDLGTTDAYRRWIQVKSPQPGTEEAERMAAALEDWAGPDVEDEDKATVLVTVMKQHSHLVRLEQVLLDLQARLDLNRVSALVIDDEADQASPNLSRERGEESATYGHIRRIRAALPSHTLLQYTATPQAPLLVSIADEISPDFVCVLDPGAEYTGGKYFFQEHREQFLKHIPASDLTVIDDQRAEPPESLLQAFAVFAVGCSAGWILKDGPHQRSMLVHPSQRTLPHENFVRWLKAVRDLWGPLLGEAESDPDRADVVETYMRAAYADLARSVPELPAFDDILRKLPSVLKRTAIKEVNAASGQSEPIEWSTGYAWVLVGGTLLDRGFTVEGLTVTYMPRPLGVGNADTVQQRARFFGYKRPYAGFCRAWLDPEVDDAFSRYVDHEEAMRSELVDIARSGESLKEWKRVFLLHRRLKLTRTAVIRLDLARPSFANEWFAQSHFDLEADDGLADANRTLVNAFANSADFRDDPGDEHRTLGQIHPMASVPLRQVLEDLLTPYVMTEEDAHSFTALRLLLDAAEEQGESQCIAHLMADGASERRQRTLNSEYRIKNLFQGSNAPTGYPGDRKIRDKDRVTVQIHRVDLLAEGAGRTVTDVPILAVWVPAHLDQAVILERSG